MFLDLLFNIVMHVHIMFLSTLKYALVYLKFNNEVRDVGMHNILFLLVLGGCYKTNLSLVVGAGCTV